MVELVKSTPNTRAVVITALRFALAPHNTALLRNSLPAFLALLKDENLVRRCCSCLFAAWPPYSLTLVLLSFVPLTYLLIRLVVPLLFLSRSTFVARLCCL